jgi:hypothetical protein
MLGLCGLGVRLCQIFWPRPRFKICKRCLRLRKRSLRLGERRALVLRIEPDQDLALAHTLTICDKHCDDATADGASDVWRFGLQRAAVRRGTAAARARCDKHQSDAERLQDL